MPWWVRALAAKPSDLSLIPEIHTVEERIKSCKLCTDLLTGMCMRVPSHKKYIFKCNSKNSKERIYTEVIISQGRKKKKNSQDFINYFLFIFGMGGHVLMS